MIHACVLLAASAVGVDAGWQPTEDGALEYIIQIDPNLVDTLRAGESITSQIPAELGEVRRYRIIVGNQPLPREGVVTDAAGRAGGPGTRLARQTSGASRTALAVPAAGDVPQLPRSSPWNSTANRGSTRPAASTTAGRTQGRYDLYADDEEARTPASDSALAQEDWSWLSAPDDPYGRSSPTARDDRSGAWTGADDRYTNAADSRNPGRLTPVRTNDPYGNDRSAPRGADRYGEYSRGAPADDRYAGEPQRGNQQPGNQQWGDPRWDERDRYAARDQAPVSRTNASAPRQNDYAWPADDRAQPAPPARQPGSAGTQQPVLLKPNTGAPQVPPGGQAPSGQVLLTQRAADGDRPWTTLALALAALVGSLAGNLYLGTVWLDAERRYRRSLVKRRYAEGDSAE